MLNSYGMLRRRLVIVEMRTDKKIWIALVCDLVLLAAIIGYWTRELWAISYINAP